MSFWHVRKKTLSDNNNPHLQDGAIMRQMAEGFSAFSEIIGVIFYTLNKSKALPLDAVESFLEEMSKSHDHPAARAVYQMCLDDVRDHKHHEILSTHNGDVEN